MKSTGGLHVANALLRKEWRIYTQLSRMPEWGYDLDFELTWLYAGKRRLPNCGLQLYGQALQASLMATDPHAEAPVAYNKAQSTRTYNKLLREAANSLRGVV